MEIIEKNIDEIIPYERNPRHNEEAVPYVKESIQAFGFQQPLVIDTNNVIVVGHTRWMAAKELGLKKVPCKIASDLTDEQIKAYRIADNKTNEYSTWDFELLEAELGGIDMQLDSLQFEFEEAEEKKKEKPEIEFTEELFEKHNYVVLYFDNEVDWLQCESILQLKSVSALPTSKKGTGAKFNRIGVGRVINGAKAMEMIKNANLG